VRDYQCILIDEVWHATQEQSNPPVVTRGNLNDGCWTICCKWATFLRGYERRRPSCAECLKHCVFDEEKFGTDLRPERIEKPGKKKKR
jgi:hypothetical protein